jgi:hypothetical protein
LPLRFKNQRPEPLRHFGRSAKEKACCMKRDRFSSAFREGRRLKSSFGLPGAGKSPPICNRLSGDLIYKGTEDRLKVFVEVLSLIAFLLGSPVNVQLRPDSVAPARPAPVQADIPLRTRQSVPPLK